MLKRFLPNQANFFELFQKSTDILVAAAKEFEALLHHLNDQQKYADAISDYEEKADEVAHSTYELLHKTFITPFDRHDISQLTSRLDDILDLMNRCAQRFPYYQIKKFPEELISLAGIALQSCVLVQKAIYRIHSLKKSHDIFKICEEIDANESKAHQFVIAGEKKLFVEENDFKNFFKLKEIYSQTKLVINACRDVSNTIKGIILEYS